MTTFTHFDILERTPPFPRRGMLPAIRMRLFGHRDGQHDAQWERTILQDLQHQQVDEERFATEARVRLMGIIH